jgi:hypothetical protein
VTRAREGAQRLVVVLGMHRSGTSATARALQVFGVDLGERLEPPDAAVNAKGYFEDMDIVALNDEMLAEAGRDWASLVSLEAEDFERLRGLGYVERAGSLLRGKLATGRTFGFKDPRTAKLLDLWSEVFQAGGYDVRYVFAVRNPLSVARSLARRDGFALECAYELWFEHVVSCLSFLADKAAAVVDYDLLMSDPRGQLLRMQAVVDQPIDEDGAAAFVEEFLAQDLRHFVSTAGEVLADKAAGASVREAAELVERLALGTARPGDKSVREAVAAWIAERSRSTPLLRALDRTLFERRRDLRLFAAATAAALAAKEQASTATALLGESDHRRRELEVAYAAMRGSIAWRATAPVRRSVDLVKALVGAARAAPEAVRIGGGLRATAATTLRVLWREGFAGLAARIRHVELSKPAVGAAAQQVVAPLVEPLLACEPSAGVGPAPLDRMLLHLHIEDVAALAACAPALAACADVQCVATVSDTTRGALDACRKALGGWRSVDFVAVADVGALMSFVARALPRAADVDYVGHLRVGGAASDRAETLVGIDGRRVAALVDRLAKGAPVTLLDRLEMEPPTVCEADALELVRRCDAGLADHGSVAPVDGRRIDGFWARHDALSRLPHIAAALGAHAASLPGSASVAEAALHAAFVPAVATPTRRALRLFTGDATADHRHHEPQADFSGGIRSDDVAVLAYYLPQFHPIPENDAWHGVGFTEWTKVRAASPLFVGHHQQHVPHADVGHYLLDSADVLRRQAEDMRKAGVHGQVFYHYWFGGRLILEKPAQLLLASPDVPMRYCFCWANENWTRRWDGNEREVLLAQAYSPEDAVAFIRHLIPFFRDPRYLTVDGRPLLFVYRPSSIPDAKSYVAAWRRECEAAGLPPPFVVAVLTRGATDPRDFGMDAATERVLHDWTAGAVVERKEALAAYASIAGRVIDYDDVAAHYEPALPAGETETYRSIVPTWDNTPRYGRDAYVVRGSTPRRFQAWLARLVRQARERLPKGRRFVLVNAWNEWAEGAHLEADERNGHAYLNCVGRALADIAYPAHDARIGIPKGLRIGVRVGEAVANRLSSDDRFREAFVGAMRRSSLFAGCQPFLVDGRAATELAGILPAAAGPVDYLLEIRRPCLFGREALRELMLRAVREPGVVVIANAYDRDRLVDDVDEDGRVADATLSTAALSARSATSVPDEPLRVRIALAARCFPMASAAFLTATPPTVTTVVRFHSGGSVPALRNALGCLAAMTGCRVVPLLALQDLDAATTAAVRGVVDEFDWAPGVEPKLIHHRSPGGVGDLRARMLDDSLRQAETRYVGFLDHDDLLLPHAYAWLTRRLEQTGKAIAFGRVYQSSYDRRRDLIRCRSRVYESGARFEDFVANNFAPLHSFLLDRSRLDLGRVRHFDDQRYMEDYFLMLQLVTRDNADWQGLAMREYVGDYLHANDGGQTLAITDPAERLRMLADPLYQLCQRRIDELRQSMR